MTTTTTKKKGVFTLLAAVGCSSPVLLLLFSPVLKRRVLSSPHTVSVSLRCSLFLSRETENCLVGEFRHLLLLLLFTLLSVSSDVSREKHQLLTYGFNMSSFSQSAFEMLQAAEEALAQPRGIRRSSSSSRQLPSAYAYKNNIENDGQSNGYAVHCDPNSSGNNLCAPETSTVRELQSQLNRAMRELIELRAELVAERDRRNETLVALGRQWKEDVLVAVHRGDAALQSDVAALEEKLTAQMKEGSESRLVLRRQLEEAVRAAKVRDAERFQLREELQETTRQVEERVEVALAQSTAARADCSRQLEQERAALAQRLDTELLRLVEMRREDQRALQDARDALRQDHQRAGEEARRAVQELWQSSATALIKTATEPVEQLRAELRQCKAAVQSAEEKVADCVRSCQAECRLHTTTTAERLQALESAAAVTTSRVDRAERKADGAYETVGRMEASVQAARDATERAQLQAASALERTQKVEHAFSDRDGRLVALESQLHAIATAEGLKAEVEACKRQAGRLESRMDATGALCERVEQLADKTVRQVQDFTDRIGSCEKAVQRSGEAVRGVQEAVAACQAESQQAQTNHEVVEGVLQRHGQLMTQLEQRVVGQENRLGLWRQQQEQHMKDQQTVQREAAERAEVMYAVSSRAQQVSSDARAEVSRLGRHFDDVDRGLAAGTTETTALRAAVESLRTQGLALQRQLQQQEDQLRAMETRVQQRVEPLAELESTVAQRFERNESQTERLVQTVTECEKHLQEMGGRVQDYLKDAVRHHVGESQRRLLVALNEGLSRLSERLNEIDGTVAEVQAKSNDTPQQLQTLHDHSTALQRSLQALETRLQAVRGSVEQLSVQAEAQSDDHQQLGTVQQDVTRLGVAQRRLQEDLVRLQEMVQTLRETQLTVAAPARDQTLSRITMSQPQTTSTEIAHTNEGDSSSPSARIPAGAVAQVPSQASAASSPPATTATTAAATAAAGRVATMGESPTPKKTTVIPPLAAGSINAASTLQAQQEQQRASSNSTEESKDNSVERPASQLSGVSSVRPTEEVARLHSLAEPAAHTTTSSDSEAEGGGGRHGNAAATQRPQPTSSRPPSAPAEKLEKTSTAVETAEKVSAPAALPSTQVSGLVNTSHATVIRGFNTITSSSSSDSDTESGKDSAAPRSSPPPHSRPAASTDDVMSDLTTEVTLTSDTAATPQRGGGGGSRRVQPTTAQQRRTVTMTATAAWGRTFTDPSADNTPMASTRAAGAAAAPEATQGANVDRTAVGATAAAAAATVDTVSDDDVVQVAAPNVERNAWFANQQVAASAPQAAQHLSSPADAAAAAVAAPQGRSPVTTATDGSVQAPRHVDWDDWDEDESEAESDAATPARAAAPPAVVQTAQADGSDESDAVMQMNEMEEDVEEAALPQAQPQPAASSASDTDDSSASSSAAASRLAATTVHHRAPPIEEPRATERRVFVSVAGHPVDGSPEPRHVVPRHGLNTTSSSSSSAERAEALGLRAGGATAPGQRPAPQVRQYTNFDDSTSDDD